MSDFCDDSLIESHPLNAFAKLVSACPDQIAYRICLRNEMEIIVNDLVMNCPTDLLYPIIELVEMAASSEDMERFRHSSDIDSIRAVACYDMIELLKSKLGNTD